MGALPRAATLLTAGYGIGEIIGPLVSQPLLGTGYSALLLGGVIVVAATLAAVALRGPISAPGKQHDRAVPPDAGRALAPVGRHPLPVPAPLCQSIVRHGTNESF